MTIEKAVSTAGWVVPRRGNGARSFGNEIVFFIPLLSRIANQGSASAGAQEATRVQVVA